MQSVKKYVLGLYKFGKCGSDEAKGKGRQLCYRY